MRTHLDNQSFAGKTPDRFHQIPITVNGILASGHRISRFGRSDYKLITKNNLEYFILSDPKWLDILPAYCGENVRIVGRLSLLTMTLIVQKIFPKTGQDNQPKFLALKQEIWLKNMASRVGEFIFVSFALWALMVT